MLERVTTADGVVFYRSPVLARAGVPHGFSTRLGGVSAGPFGTLNLGNPNGCATQDGEAGIEENYRRLHAACGLSGRRRCWAHQVHGAAVVVVNDTNAFVNAQKADALVTAGRDAAVAVRTADCVPVLLSTADGRAVAAAHAGWRGVVAGVVPAAALALRALPGVDPAVPLLAAIGPCLSAAAFEVGDEVAAAFTGLFGADAPVGRPTVGGKAHVDLREAVRLQLIEIGLTDDAIDSTDRCSARHADEFFSHRRDNGVTGRMAAMIGVRDG